MHRLAYITLWMFVFTIPWQNSLPLESVGTVSQAVGIVAFLTTMLWCLSAGRLLRPSRTLLLTAAFATYALLSAGWSLDPRRHTVAGTDDLPIACYVLAHFRTC